MKNYRELFHEAETASVRQQAPMNDRERFNIAETESLRQLTPTSITNDSNLMSMSTHGGMSSMDVKEIQATLNRLGIRDKNGNKLAVDGFFGPLTDSAVRNFQRQNGLVVDGIVGPQTRGTLGSQEPDFVGAGNTYKPEHNQQFVNDAETFRDADIASAHAWQSRQEAQRNSEKLQLFHDLNVMPYDRFGTKRGAINTWARHYHTLSGPTSDFRRGSEWGAWIYRDPGTGEYMFGAEPMARSQNLVALSPRNPNYDVVAAIHTHPIDPIRPHLFGEYFTTTDGNVAHLNAVPAYLATPNAVLRRVEPSIPFNERLTVIPHYDPNVSVSNPNIFSR